MNRPNPIHPPPAWQGDVRIASAEVQLEGTLTIPRNARGLVLFVHGSGSSRHSSRNRHVARVLQEAGLGTLLFDLLTQEEEQTDEFIAHLRFDIPFLSRRLEITTRWALEDDRAAQLRIGYFGASTGAAAALMTAAITDLDIGAIVSRGGRPDLAGDALGKVHVPTLLIVGGADEQVIPLNERAYARLRGEKRLEIVSEATHLFEEPDALDTVAELAGRWFAEYLLPEGWHP
jgi:putative phosphoribosyl transferase